MRVDRFRVRIMSLLGLPLAASAGHACAAQSGQDPAEEPTTVVAVGEQGSATPLAATADPSSAPSPLNERPWQGCRRDQTLEWFCGGRAPGQQTPLSSCSKRPEHIQRVASLMLPDTDGAALSFDVGMSRLYARHIEDDANACCYSKCRDLTVLDAPTTSVRRYGHRMVCISPPTGGVSKPAKMRVDCPAAISIPGAIRPEEAAPFNALESTAEAARLRQRSGFNGLNPCCYDAGYRRPPNVRLGRALRADNGELLQAPAVRSDGWLRAVARAVERVSVSELSHSMRQRVGRRWLADAALEHASVAAFSKLALQLMALGAPAELVEACHRAALDEIAHAELSYALASRYLDASHGPGALPLPKEIAVDAEALLLETLLDGCLGETVAALWAARSTQACSQPALGELYGRIAEDEQRHAELAWRIVAWLYAEHPAARAALQRGIAHFEELAASAEPPRPDSDWEELRTHGWLSVADHAALERTTLRQLALPCARALLRDGRRAGPHAPRSRA